MKVHVPSIKPEGKDFSFDQSEGWFAALLKERLAESYRDGAPASAHIRLDRVNENVTASGSLQVQLSPSCSSCGQVFSHWLKVPFLWHLTAYIEDREVKGTDEEVELNADDLDFSFYKNDEIDLGALVMEEALLALPIRFLCKDSCQGLCPRCGANLNEGPCACGGDNPTHPFAALQGFKVKT